MSIDEVLRLLTRSKQQGSVNVTGGGLHGRVFVGRSGIDLATTSDNEDLRRHLLNAGYTDEKTLNRVTSGETTLAAIAEDNQAIVDLLREMTVESLYQISTRGDEFQVYEGATSPYASPRSFDLEALLHDTDERKREWGRVREIIVDLNTPVAFRRDLGDRDEVTIKRDDWRVLSEIQAGASIAEIADTLGTTQFWTARVASRLIKNELIVLRGTSDAAMGPFDAIDEQEPDTEYDTEHAVPSNEYSHETDAVDDADHERLSAEAPVFQDAASEDQDDDVDPHESWWSEPRAEDEPEDDEGEHTPEVVSNGSSDVPPVDDSEDESDSEGDPEKFLEKVFAELESSESEAEGGHGLLRRRRMGSLRDFSSDS